MNNAEVYKTYLDAYPFFKLRKFINLNMAKISNFC
jgi:hypothetical protein